jgi:hypothetical protein
VDHLEQVVSAKEEYAVACTACGVTERASEEGLADTDGSEEEDVFVSVEEAEPEEITDTVAVEGDGRVEVEVLEGMKFVEARAVEPVREVLVVTPSDLVGECEFEEVERSQVGFLCMGSAIRQRSREATELKPPEHSVK